MNKMYLDLMERALSAYPEAHIRRYFRDVTNNGLTEHGFPRLTANMGILIAHGRRRELTPLFLAMMDFCCQKIPTVKAANDFSVREIVCCIAELERSGAVEKERIDFWKRCLTSIEPEKCYTVYAKSPTDPVRNWALFTAVSEFFRLRMGLGGSMEFIEIQIASQLQWLDENGMYMDNAKEQNHQPMVYDLVARGLFSLLLHAGYRGKYVSVISGNLKKAGIATLYMQSVTGELPFGGRSNQFLHNEAWLAALFEFEAHRYKEEGDPVLAGTYKAAAARAMGSIGRWLHKDPISHIKNRYPIDSKFGCEIYAYFDKYMITAASFLYAAALFCDESITPAPFEKLPRIYKTTDYFHKLFLRAGDYCLEFDTDADPTYDASGLGRVHKANAPPPLCISVPCPPNPVYTVDRSQNYALAICPGVLQGGAWEFACDHDAIYTLTDSRTTDHTAFAELTCQFPSGKTVKTDYTVDETGVSLTLTGSGALVWMLPAFRFDGEAHTDVTVTRHCLTVSYDGWQCIYTTNGEIWDTGRVSANRNGLYRAYCAGATDSVKVKITIIPTDTQQ